MRSMLVLLLLCLGFSSCLSAQKATPKKIVFTGYTLASQSELLAASGLTQGAPLGQPEIGAAAQHLADSGLFSDVNFGFDGQTLTFMLKPASGALPVMYQNFPWWDSVQLTASLANRVPLFHGLVIPESGLQTQLVSALTAMVAEKGVHAVVTAVKVEKSPTNPEGVALHIDSPAIEVGEVKLAGLAPEWVEPVGAIQKAASGQPFDEATQATLDTALRVVYHRQGYLEESMRDFSHGAPALDGDKVAVPLAATVDEGPQYHLAALTLAGDVLMSQDAFAKQAKIHAGDVANEDLLHETLASISIPYKIKGYLRASITAIPAFNRTQHTVRYDIVVTPGAVYHMGKLDVTGLSDERKALVLQYWTLREGDVFDASYPPSFLNKNAKTLHPLDGWSASYKQYEHEDTHIVDMVVAFHPDSSLR